MQPSDVTPVLVLLVGGPTLIVLGVALLAVVRIVAAPRRAPTEGWSRADQPEVWVLAILGWVLVISGLAAVGLLACFLALGAESGLAVGVIVAVVGLVVLGMVLLRQSQSRQYMLLSTLAVAAERLMPLAPAVDAFAEERSWLMRSRARRLAALLRSGLTLPEALHRTPGLVSREAQVTIRVGQESGSLAHALRDVVRSHQLHTPLWNQTMGRALYLFGVVLFGAVNVVFMSVKIAPMFQKIFQEFGAELPPITQVTIGVGHAFAAWGFLTFPLLLVFIVAFLLFGIQYVAGVRFSLPIVNWLTRRLDTAQILEALSLAAQRNVPFGGQIETLARWYPRGSIRKRLRAVLRDLNAGVDWSTSLARHGLIRQAELAVFQAAGRAGNLSWALREMADSNRRRLNYRIYTLVVQVLFPLAVLAIGLLVMIYVVSYFLPLISLIQNLT